MMIIGRKEESALRARTLSAVVGTGLLLLCAAGCHDDSRPSAGVPYGGMTSADHTPTGKDLLLLHGESRLQTDSLPERIRRLKREIARGEGVYSHDELELLERQLAECEEQYRVIQQP